MGFIAVFIKVYLARPSGNKMKTNFDLFKQHLVLKFSTLKPHQTRAHLSKYRPRRFGVRKLGLVSVVTKNVMTPKRHVECKAK